MNHKLIQVKNAMHLNNFQFVDGTLTVAEGIKIAKEHNVSILIINKRNNDDEYGMVMLADIAKKVLAKDRSPERVNLYEIMAKPLISVPPTMDIRYCSRLFETFGIHTAPVIDSHTIIGMVDYTAMVLAEL
jgi:predicted transcriptional regulator